MFVNKNFTILLAPIIKNNKSPCRDFFCGSTSHPAATNDGDL